MNSSQFLKIFFHIKPIHYCYCKFYCRPLYLIDTCCIYIDETCDLKQTNSNNFEIIIIILSHEMINFEESTT